MSYLDKLDEMEGAWGSSEAQKGQGDVFVPPGKYQVKVESAKIHEIKRGDNKGSVGVGWRFRIIGGQHEGTVISSFAALVSEENIGYFKGDLNTLGVDTNFKFKQLPQKLEEVINSCVEVTVQHNTGKNGQKYQNIYLNKLVDSPGGFADDEEEEEEEEEVKPKKRTKKASKKGSKKKRGRPKKAKPEPEPEPEDDDDDDESWDDDPWEDEDEE